MKKIPVVDYGAVQNTYNTNNKIEDIIPNGISSETEQILSDEVIIILFITFEFFMCLYKKKKSSKFKCYYMQIENYEISMSDVY